MADVVGGKCAGQMARDVLSKSAVSSTEEDAREEPLTPVAVQGHDRIHVAEEALEMRGVRGIDVMRGDMPFQVGRLVDSVVGGIRSLGDASTDDIGQFFESTPVVRHDPEVASQLTYLFDVGVLEEVAKGHRADRPDFDRRLKISASVTMAINTTASDRPPTSWSHVVTRD